MGKPKDCSHCKKPATIHLTQIINNQIKKLDFCDDCAHQNSITDPGEFSLADLLANGPEIMNEAMASSISCPSCGFTPAEFKKVGRFGCPNCYEAFRETIAPMLVNMHRGQIHTGKVPQRMLTRINRRREIERISHDLEDAVIEERYEDAARYRDELKQLNEAVNIKKLEDYTDP